MYNIIKYIESSIELCRYLDNTHLWMKLFQLFWWIMKADVSYTLKIKLNHGGLKLDVHSGDRLAGAQCNICGTSLQIHPGPL